MNNHRLIPFIFCALLTSCNNETKNDSFKEATKSESKDEKRIAVFIKPKNKIINKNNLEFLKKYNNQYSFDFEMLKIKELRKRIIQLVGEDNFKTFFEIGLTMVVFVSPTPIMPLQRCEIS